MGALRIASGGVVWALHFGAIYVITALACARGAPGVIPWATGTATAVAIGLVVAIIGRAVPERRHFAAWMTMAVGTLALAAIVFEAFALVLVPACGS